MQTTSHILMIRPARFAFNQQTAVNNAFQVPGNNGDVQLKALEEFDQFVALLRANNITVTVVNDTPEPHTPDSIFPNNWISFHEDNSVVLYPMFALNRRLERNTAIIDLLGKQPGSIIDLSHFEAEEKFLEGTGSMVLDREYRIAYACISPRTNEQVLQAFAQKMNYTTETFHSIDGQGRPVYHTNVMMCVARQYVVICLESIPDAAERDHITTTINRTKKEIVPITLEQMNHFAGNMLQVHNNNGEPLLIMSTQAYRSLTPDQVSALSGHNRILHSNISTIETNGGGSARCMMAEVFGDCILICR